MDQTFTPIRNDPLEDEPNLTAFGVSYYSRLGDLIDTTRTEDAGMTDLVVKYMSGVTPIFGWNEAKPAYSENFLRYYAADRPMIGHRSILQYFQDTNRPEEIVSPFIHQDEWPHKGEDFSWLGGFQGAEAGPDVVNISNWGTAVTDYIRPALWVYHIGSGDDPLQKEATYGNTSFGVRAPVENDLIPQGGSIVVGMVGADTADYLSIDVYNVLISRVKDLLAKQFEYFVTEKDLTPADTSGAEGEKGNPLNVRARLNSLRDMEDGWADGMQAAKDWGTGYGKAPSHSGLDWLSSKFESFYPSNAPLPYLYPTPEGGIQAEWSLNKNEISLEVDLVTHAAEWHCIDLITRASELRELDMENPNDWFWLTMKIQQLGSTVE